jgi:hypothetical protein
MCDVDKREIGGRIYRVGCMSGEIGSCTLAHGDHVSGDRSWLQVKLLEIRRLEAKARIRLHRGTESKA